MTVNMPLTTEVIAIVLLVITFLGYVSHIKQNRVLRATLKTLEPCAFITIVTDRDIITGWYLETQKGRRWDNHGFRVDGKSKVFPASSAEQVIQDGKRLSQRLGFCKTQFLYPICKAYLN